MSPPGLLLPKDNLSKQPTGPDAADTSYPDFLIPPTLLLGAPFPSLQAPVLGLSGGTGETLPSARPGPGEARRGAPAGVSSTCHPRDPCFAGVGSVSVAALITVKRASMYSMKCD